jgi:hypothetical protein
MAGKHFARRSKKFVVAGLAVSTGAVAVAGMAAAAWMSTGTGTATVKASTSKASTITAVAGTSADDLYPGATKATKVTIDNPNPYPVVVTSISAGSSALTNGTCAAATVTIDAISNASGIAQVGGSTVKIAAGGSGSYSLVTHMTANADNACQGQTFALALSASLQSNA